MVMSTQSIIRIVTGCGRADAIPIVPDTTDLDTKQAVYLKIRETMQNGFTCPKNCGMDATYQSGDRIVGYTDFIRVIVCSLLLALCY